MVTQITKGIKISVRTEYEGSFFKARTIHFAFSYEITTENQSNHLVQLFSRHWKIQDALNDSTIVEGEGVLGEKPIIKPGEYHRYKSGCVLTSPYGAMKGFYRMLNLSTSKSFKVIIPSFKLASPFALN
jgi:ApaG protein